MANAALDKYEKKKQELEKLEALLERLPLSGAVALKFDSSEKKSHNESGCRRDALGESAAEWYATLSQINY